MRPLPTLIPLLALLAALLLPAANARAAAGSLRGYAELDYAGYRAEVDGGEDVEASHFTQQYSLLYQKQGTLLGGRGGSYTLALGGEWNSVAAEVDGDDFGIDTFKILYNGDLLLAPGGLPFRLHLYSRDMRKSMLLSDSHPLLSGGEGFADFTLEGKGKILDPRIATDISNGQHIESGATLLVGIRNGSYLGRYRDILSQLPRLLIDYRQVYVRDVHGSTPQHYLSRDLAFVSLNKKDNWFHYRLSQYRDYNHRDSDFTTKTYMLGTVDHALARQWINLTNWIKISVDGSLVVAELPQNRATGIETRTTETYYLNLFAKTRRTKYESATFTNLSRMTADDGGLARQLEVPVYASGELDRNTAWRSRFIGRRSEDADLQPLAQDDNLFLSAEVETFRNRLYTLKGALEGELRQGTEGEGGGSRATFELFSNRRFERRASQLGRYSVAYFSGNSEEGTPVDYLEQTLSGSVDYRLSARVRLGLSEEVTYGRGDAGSNLLSHIRFVNSSDFKGESANVQRATSESLYRNRLKAFAEYNRGRLHNRLEASYETFAQDGAAEDQFSVRQRLDYRQRAYTIKTINELLWGGELQDVLHPEIVVLDAPTVSGIDSLFTHTSSVSYLPSRNWELEADAEYRRADGEGGGSNLFNLHQRADYSLYTANGIVRKLAQLSEEFEFEWADLAAGGNGSAFRLRLGGDYFPTHHLYVGASTAYIYTRPVNAGQLFFNLSTGLNYAKFKIGLDYSYGNRSSAEGIDARNEHRWEVAMQKAF